MKCYWVDTSRNQIMDTNTSPTPHSRLAHQTRQPHQQPQKRKTTDGKKLLHHHELADSFSSLSILSDGDIYDDDCPIRWPENVFGSVTKKCFIAVRIVRRCAQKVSVKEIAITCEMWLMTRQKASNISSRFVVIILVVIRKFLHGSVRVGMFYNRLTRLYGFLIIIVRLFFCCFLQSQRRKLFYKYLKSVILLSQQSSVRASSEGCVA